jgi:N-acetylneuraminic acid mutarotase
LWKYDPSVNNWTWIKGDSLAYQYAIYGTQTVSAPSNKPGARGYCTSWKDNNGNFWLFGGLGYTASANGFLNDLWKYNPATNDWTWMKGDNTPGQFGVYGTIGVSSISNKPGARDGCISWVDQSGNLWLFGGYGLTVSGSSGYLNDLWKYDPLTNEWTWFKGDNTINQYGVYGVKGVSASTNKPGGRGQCSSWTDASGNFWLFGGGGYAASTTQLLNDIWKYNPITNEWIWINGDNVSNQTGIYGTQGIETSANKPGGRSGTISWIDGSGNVYLFGGDANISEYTDFNDLWKYNPISNRWTWLKGDTTINQGGVYVTQGVASSLNKPGCRWSSVNWIDNSGNLWMFGGANNGKPDIAFNDIWKLDPVGTCGTGFTWIGVTSTDWTVGSNWCGGVVPGVNDDAIVPGGTLYNATVPNGITVSVRSLSIQTGAQVFIDPNAHLNVMH